jgi:hypothetical protein
MMIIIMMVIVMMMILNDTGDCYDDIEMMVMITIMNDDALTYKINCLQIYIFTLCRLDFTINLDME